MKSVLIFLSCIYVINTSNTADPLIVNNYKPWDGQRYFFVYRTESGNFRKESGKLKRNSAGDTYIDVIGQYAIPLENDEQTLQYVEYTANESGYSITRSHNRTRTQGPVTESEIDIDEKLPPAQVYPYGLPMPLIATLLG